MVLDSWVASLPMVLLSFLTLVSTECYVRDFKNLFVNSSVLIGPGKG